MQRYEHLTAASLAQGTVTDDFADLILKPTDDPIAAALKSGYTRALFNGVVAVKHAEEPRLMLDLLVSINRNANKIDDWRVIEEGKIDLELTLEMIQMELLESAPFCGDEAIPLLRAALATDNDVLHFGVFSGVRESADPAFANLILEYISEFEHRTFHADSRSYLLDAVNDALSACLVV